ncbi:MULTISPECIES: LysR family transcriptional regulator [Paraburkholderia]|uniref:LysR family transcriptional regulator n=1 Tax=Paraburkholderia TaxID=1822464 RepID=UPI002253F5AB|nr:MULTISPECIES: LysR family transcriptional regulator [Paraburkholderia]MCX4161808.1 LysR family transcriptional regulator [Paraburkholderia megapolitana]MDN7157305.1 LysR family transcriptional regulator [Paraburkholderia sp. CHISQ3]MDQ6494350.1 LysR family transcriptional regulator [Paraburkholderia megapolitana]
MKRYFDDLQLGSIELFCLAAEAGSFTSAALAGGVTPAAVSRSIARLEKRLGVRLFVRSTRSIRLTESGKSYYEECSQALNQLVEAERNVTGEQAQPGGTLRITAPTTYGHHRLLPMLPAFRAKYPLIKLEVHVGNRNVDLHDENYDLAIRVRAQPDSTMIVRLLEDAPLVMVASPAYLKRAGVPRTLAELEQHECIQFDLPSSGRRISWLFNEDGHEKEMSLNGNYSCSEDVLAGVTLAKAGAGLFQAYRFVVEKDLADGTLVEVLQPFGGRSRPYSLLYPHGRLLPLRVRAFIDFMMEEIGRLQAAAGTSPVKARRAKPETSTKPAASRR